MHGGEILRGAMVLSRDEDLELAFLEIFHAGAHRVAAGASIGRSVGTASQRLEKGVVQRVPCADYVPSRLPSHHLGLNRLSEGLVVNLCICNI